jgi:uncharacterized membrane protein
MKRFLILGFIMGMCYFTLEGFWRGWTNIVMLFVGGLCGALIGLLDEYPQYFNLKIWQQTLISLLVILVIEYSSGMLLNVWLGMRIWDYSSMPVNLNGQICLIYALLWIPLIPFGIWLDNWLRWKLFGEEKPYHLLNVYHNLLTLK